VVTRRRSHLDDFLDHIDKAGVEHSLLQGGANANILFEDGGGVVTQVLPPLHSVGILNGAVVALAQSNGLLELEPAAGLQMGVALLRQLVPVGDGAGQGADVDEVEALVWAEDPLGLCVVDVELCVWGHPGGLDGGEVGAEDIAAGVFVGKVYGPDAGAGADVEDAVGGRVDGGIVELAAED
jgi:hypothetical protein